MAPAPWPDLASLTECFVLSQGNSRSYGCEQHFNWNGHNHLYRICKEELDFIGHEGICLILEQRNNKKPLYPVQSTAQKASPLPSRNSNNWLYDGNNSVSDATWPAARFCSSPD